jgi:hypothetical protein
MISLAGPENLIETVLVVATAHVSRSAEQPTVPDGLDGLRTAYHRMLGEQELALGLALRDAAPLPVPVSEGPAYDALCSAFKRSILGENAGYDAFDDNASRTPEEVQAQHARVLDALDELAAEWPAFGLLYRTLVPVLLYAPDGGLAGGTSNTVLGALWLDPKPAWSRADIQEFLVHEFTHTTLYLEERRFGFYRDLPMLSEPQYLTPSVIRQDMRPLDKVFHSIGVALEILAARGGHGVPDPVGGDGLHPDTATLLANTRISLDAVFQLPLEKLVRPRPIEILELCRSRVGDVRV